MQVDDILDIKLAVDYAGVSCVFGTYWKVAQYRGPEATPSIFSSFAAAFWATMEGTITSEATLSCAKLVNLTTPEKAVVFPNLPGTNVGSGHPPHQALKVYMYGAEAGGQEQHRNAINLPAIAESLSTRGRVNNVSGFQGVVDFLVNTWVGGANQADLLPMVKRTIALGGPGLPDTHDYYATQYARLHERFGTVKSRKYRLCI